MAAEDEAMVVHEVSVSDPDNEEYLRLEIWAEKGNLSLLDASQARVDIETGTDEDGYVDGSLVVVGTEIALNDALSGLVYYPPQDWTSSEQARMFPKRAKPCHK